MIHLQQLTYITLITINICVRFNSINFEGSLRRFKITKYHQFQTLHISDQTTHHEGYNFFSHLLIYCFFFIVKHVAFYLQYTVRIVTIIPNSLVRRVQYTDYRAITLPVLIIELRISKVFFFFLRVIIRVGLCVCIACV